MIVSGAFVGSDKTRADINTLGAESKGCSHTPKIVDAASSQHGNRYGVNNRRHDGKRSGVVARQKTACIVTRCHKDIRAHRLSFTGVFHRRSQGSHDELHALFFDEFKNRWLQSAHAKCCRCSALGCRFHRAAGIHQSRLVLAVGHHHIDAHGLVGHFSNARELTQRALAHGDFFALHLTGVGAENTHTTCGAHGSR